MILSSILQAPAAAASESHLLDSIISLGVLPLILLLVLMIYINRELGINSLIREIRADRRAGIISRFEEKELIGRLKKERREYYNEIVKGGVLGVLMWISAIIIVFALAYLVFKITNGFFEDHPLLTIVFFLVDITGVVLVFYHFTNNK